MEPRASVSSDFRKLGLRDKNLGYKVIGCKSTEFSVNLNELSAVHMQNCVIVDVDFDHHTLSKPPIK